MSVSFPERIFKESVLVVAHDEPTFSQQTKDSAVLRWILKNLLKSLKWIRGGNFEILGSLIG